MTRKKLHQIALHPHQITAVPVTRVYATRHTLSRLNLDLNQEFHLPLRGGADFQIKMQKKLRYVNGPFMNEHNEGLILSQI
jgi:hypothetical protein